MAMFRFLFLIFSYSLGIFSLGMGYIFYRQYKKKIIQLFILLMAGLSMDVFSFSLLQVLEWTDMIDLPGWLLFYRIFNFTGSMVIIMGLPLMVHKLLTIEVNRIYKITYSLLWIIQALFMLAYIMNIPRGIPLNLVKAPLFLVLFITITLAILNVKNIGDAMVRKALKGIFTILVLQLPILLINEFYFQSIPEGFQNTIFFISPLLLVLLNVIIIVFSYSFFNQPLYYKDRAFTSHFQKKFDISDREMDVLNCVMEGLSREKTGEKLFISPNTVNNHIYNIYKKLGIKNKLQLLNLIQSNRD